jgi:molybdate transport system substrate-binding protein
MTRTSRLFVAALALVGLVAAGCGSSNNDSSATTAAAATIAPTPKVTGDLAVFAATSLTAAFNQIGPAFTKANPDAKVTFSFNGSSTLVQNIKDGAPADVFASADQANMDKLTSASLNGSTPVVFAKNKLAIIVPKGNPKGITGVADLAKPGTKVVLCQAQVPCGNYANQVLEAANVTVTPVSQTENVGQVVTAVTTGEADAGIVYVTDVQNVADKADAVDIPDDINVVARYPAASVKDSKHQEADAAFISFLTGSEARAILEKYGFEAP